jgi:oxygen-independent coproporphyrinogen-3 oxidase
MSDSTTEKTELGNYFVANYPPFSFWKPSFLPEAHKVLNAQPEPGTPLGLYAHIPFCRKRCKFCYFRVYTDKNAKDVDNYLDALIQEIALCSQLLVRGGRDLDFVYFGGGTPSYLSVTQLEKLFNGIKNSFSWNGAREVTFECEPGTLQQHKLAALRQMGVTRLSLGVENFNNEILESNGRAHHSAEIVKAYTWARELNFPLINIDLIAGMVGETTENWKDCIKKTIEIAPDCITIYQMELPFNTVFSKELKQVDQPDPLAVSDWPTKRAWVKYAFETLMENGYEISSAYTLVRSKAKMKFVYRDELWHGADMFGTGVASFGHINGFHLQNLDAWDNYLGELQKGIIPLGRALPVTKHQKLIREMILQLKTGHLESEYFENKFKVQIFKEFDSQWGSLEKEGWLKLGQNSANVTMDGLLQVDRLLPRFFEPDHLNARYT